MIWRVSIKRDGQPHSGFSCLATTTGKVLICYARSFSPGKRVHIQQNKTNFKGKYHLVIELLIKKF